MIVEEREPRNRIAKGGDLERRRLALFAIITVSLGVLLVVASLHGASLARSRSVDHAAIVRMASIVGPELAMHAGARWLRHPTRVEPFAYGHDGPGVPDPDPAGALASPPRSSLEAGRAVVVRARLRPAIPTVGEARR